MPWTTERHKGTIQSERDTWGAGGFAYTLSMLKEEHLWTQQQKDTQDIVCFGRRISCVDSVVITHRWHTGQSMAELAEADEKKHSCNILWLHQLLLRDRRQWQGLCWYGDRRGYNRTSQAWKIERESAESDSPDGFAHGRRRHTAVVYNLSGKRVWTAILTENRGNGGEKVRS